MKIFLFIYCSLFFKGLIFAQSFSSHEFDFIGMDEGFPSNEIYHCYEDGNGVLWFGTDNGVVRYNGNEIKIYSVKEGLDIPIVFWFYELNDGSLFAPKYIENKLKFFPDIKEAVAFGNERDEVCVFLNIDLTSVGNWAERNNISYASCQELASHPEVYATMKSHVEQVNKDLCGEELMAGAQIHRFLVLHKELDPDDGELTRTQKVRRGFIAERYGVLIDALYDGSTEQFVETEVVFEDGRKGNISATVNISDASTYPAGSHQLEAAE